jgi:hypothetical protein
MATRPTRVAVVSDHLFVNGTVFQFYTMKDRLPLDVAMCWRLGEKASESVDLSGFDVVVAKSDGEWIRSDGECFPGPYGREEYAALLRRLQTPANGFQLVQQAPLPDGSSLLVFRNTQSEGRRRS